MNTHQELFLGTLAQAIADLRSAQHRHEACCPVCVYGGKFTIGVLEGLSKSAAEAFEKGTALGPIQAQTAFMLGRVLGLVVQSSAPDEASREELAIGLIQAFANELVKFAGLQLTTTAELHEADDPEPPPSTPTQH